MRIEVLGDSLFASLSYIVVLLRLRGRVSNDWRWRLCVLAPKLPWNPNGVCLADVERHQVVEVEFLFGGLLRRHA